MKMTLQTPASLHVQRWLDTMVIAHNFCPFASYVRNNNQIRYAECESADMADALTMLQNECELLDNNPTIATTLLILPTGWAEFDDFLLLIDMAQQCIEHWDYSGTYQLATFHPDYLFDGEDPQSASHYTNRAPHPVLHIIREKDVTEALKHYDAPQDIPEVNIAKAEALGCPHLAAQLAACKSEEY
ncbi:MAG: DUF1415 domain-containing protein [Pseudomonadota bacterium]|jgi:hypothetical protein|nr:DUF1415 domain-containing protein [Pseudomonadota bacterium]BBO26834.1 DUF1415 domain-containing protein [Alteromonas sp. I4]|tara:strand:- start:2638 stop:3198 length:561 start_codon:yes stop_codon:yes gene_type:complete